MKYVFLLLFITFFGGASNLSINSNELKIGYINMNELLQLMPEIIEVNNEMQNYLNNLENIMSDMQKDFQNKYSYYENNKNEFADIIKKDKEKELEDLSNRINEYQIHAQNDINNKKNELLSPLYDNAKKVIKEIAIENNLSYIIDNSQSIIIHGPLEYDIINIVKQKLNLIKN
ncbi:MAG: OmpH family outer membrane protein [Bacteroides sp.]|nr:MAG: OmpH family outer membrane protein [Bacteroides sp.]